MDWGGVRNGRVLAGLYLVAFVSLYGGVACVLIGQWTGQAPLALGGFLFAGGLLGIFALAWGLRNRVPQQAGRFTAKASNTQLAYHRLALGLEVRQAWHVLKG
jgi:uncharacterized membrane protein YiaA